MNGLLIAVLVVLLCFAISGYRRGFLRLAFSLVSMVVTIVLVSVVTPHVTGFLKENTSIYEELVEQCARRVQISAEENVEQNLEDGAETQEAVEGLKLPQVWVEKILEKTGSTVNQFVDETGIHRMVGEYLGDWILKGIAFMATFILVSILLKFVIGLLDIIAKLPIIKGINKVLGIVAGLAQGLMVVWLLMFLLAVACTSQVGQQMLVYVEENTILTFLYENNIILHFLSFMMG